MRKLLLSVAMMGVAACASGTTEGKPATVAADAPRYAAYGMTIDRPSQWHFVQPDSTVSADTQVILHGPIGSASLAPTVEVSRRPLSAADQRRQPAQILTAMMGELAQTFDSFEAQGEIADVEVGGKKAARLDVTLTEQLSDGTEERRAAQLYAIVDGQQLWVVRGFGPGDGSANGQINDVVKNIHF